MLFKKIKLILIIFIFYQNPLYSKSTSSDNLDHKNVSKYFSGVIAFGNDNNSEALEFFDSSKILINKHNPYFKKYIYSLVLDNKVSKAINILKVNKDKKNSNFFEAYLLMTLDNLIRNDFEKAFTYLIKTAEFAQQDKLNLAILETLKQYIYVFKENKILDNKKNLGHLSIISETFQRCYLGDDKTDTFFSRLFDDPRSDYTRYIYFYLGYLIENNRLSEAKSITDNIEYINTTLLLSQGKSWVENGKIKKFLNVFSCKNPNDIVSEFLFLISNLYSSQDDFKRSNFYLNLSYFLNPKFVFNLSLVAENQFSSKEYDKAKKTLANFKKQDEFYYWYRVKKEAQIIAKKENQEKSLNFVLNEFNKIKKYNNKFIFDIASFYKNSKKYNEAIEYYSKIIDTLDDNSEIKSDLLYRRGGSYERIKKYKEADKDLLYSLKLNPNDAYVLNYLAYSWLERNYKINEAIIMLETAYELESEDPYIIDSIGWAYYLTGDYLRAEEFLKRAVEMMPDDPIVNDHYGDILWKLNRKIQARYFWRNVAKMNDVENEMLEKVNIKMVKGL